MHPLEVACYSLIVLANMETLLGICLTSIAIASDRKLWQNSNLMMACLLIPALARVIVCNLQVIEFYHPGFVAIVSDRVCLVVFRLGMLFGVALTMWLLLAIAVHRYFLCVKMMSQIDNTKTCLATALLSFTPGVLVASMGSIWIWWRINFDGGHGHFTPITKNITENGIVLGRTNDTNIWILDSVENPLKNADILSTEGCVSNNYEATNIEKMLAVSVSWVLPMVVQFYFYNKIYQHLNEEQQRFRRSHQVTTRLHTNSREVLNTLLATFVCHFISYIPVRVIRDLDLAPDLMLITNILAVNGSNIGTLCFLVLHGGYR